MRGMPILFFIPMATSVLVESPHNNCSLLIFDKVSATLFHHYWTTAGLVHDDESSWAICCSDTSTTEAQRTWRMQLIVLGVLSVQCEVYV